MALRSVRRLLRPDREKNDWKESKELRNAKSRIVDNTGRGFDWREKVVKELYEEDFLDADELYDIIREEGSEIQRSAMLTGINRMACYDIVEKIDQIPPEYSLTELGEETVETYFSDNN